MPEIKANSTPTRPLEPAISFNPKEALELASKSIIALVGLCYVIGLIVRNIHLSRYGYYTVGLLELSYILAGVWALLPMILGAMLLNWANTLFRLYTEEEDQIPLNRKVKPTTKRVVFSLLYSLLSALGFARFSHDYLGLPFSWQWAGITLLGILVIGLMAVVTHTFVLPVGINFSTRLFFMTLSFVSLGFYLSLFARHFYKDIPSGIGGGRPELVRLVTANDFKPYLVASGIQFQDAEGVTEPTEMIIGTNSEYILRAKTSGKTVIVPRDAVKALIFEAH